MLDLGGIPVHAKDRHGLQNLVIAGGPMHHTMQPLAIFIDLFLIGDGKDVLDFTNLYLHAKRMV